jgi:glycosyltransferase involved in cell wall biosynthesis
MRNAYVGVHASYAEGLPMSVLELMAYGVPVIVSDIVAHREAMGDISWQFAVGDKEALAERITRAIMDSAWVALGPAYARQRIALRYDWDALAKQLSNRYAALAGRATQDIKNASISAKISEISG